MRARHHGATHAFSPVFFQRLGTFPRARRYRAAIQITEGFGTRRRPPSPAVARRCPPPLLFPPPLRRAQPDAPDVMVVHDTLKDVRFAETELVQEWPNIRFYAGAPLRVSRAGVTHKIGTLCVIDRATEMGGGGARSHFSVKEKQVGSHTYTLVVQCLGRRAEDRSRPRESATNGVERRSSFRYAARCASAAFRGFCRCRVCLIVALRPSAARRCSSTSRASSSTRSSCGSSRPRSSRRVVVLVLVLVLVFVLVLVLVLVPCPRPRPRPCPRPCPRRSRRLASPSPSRRVASPRLASHRARWF